VYDAVLQLPCDTWQHQPQSEQPTSDKACLIDIAAVTASGVKVAIEVEGPYHYVQPDNTLTGSTLFRNRALAARGFTVISIPHWDWGELRSAAQQQQYLLDKLQAVQQQHVFSVAPQPPPLPAPPTAATQPGVVEGDGQPSKRRRLSLSMEPGSSQGM
jgi:hypothetical protein